MRVLLVIVTLETNIEVARASKLADKTWKPQGEKETHLHQYMNFIVSEADKHKILEYQNQDKRNHTI